MSDTHRPDRSTQVRIDGRTARLVEAHRAAVARATGITPPTSAVVSALVRAGLASASAPALDPKGTTP